ncbi:ATP-grasp domain-containing protein [Nocardia puris]|uniref:ATP-grasp domain-containing protein n=1 Tax=Nocardia puris TaxID=208602 RepID=UPI001893765A|nr:ATP-grasp domain-containing protein [Nocardia puris]MBF6209446.1 ATP-grasp domain-containing protein [Nocardia puris]MBF6367812.1 ATP-grasp domain-containing protein [Nocardia puris]MBF6461464.1 ATP-grasp domain-containing protein [Nocardia puris]
MTSNDILLVIGSGLRLYREYLVRSVTARARAAGLDLVLLNNLEPTWQDAYFDEIVVANVFDHDILAARAREIAARRRVAGVLCWDEPLVQPAADLAEEFGVPGLSATGVRGCRDKNRTRAVLTDAGLVQPLFELTTTPEQAGAAAERIGYPVVVKPQALGASMGVVLARDHAELDTAFTTATGASTIGDAPFRGTAIVEEYAVGPEISVDAAVYKGEYLPMFLARKRTGLEPYFEELGHLVDGADPLLADETLLTTLAAAHRALGVENGTTHTEVRLTARGPLIIEVNGRLGGDLIPFLGKIATGIDPGEVLVDVATGHRPATTPTRRAAAGIRFGYPEHDLTVRSVTVPEHAPGLVTAAAMVEPGAELRLPPGGYIARHSFVVCEAADAPRCADLLRSAADAVEVTGDPLEPLAAGTTFTLPAGLLDADK